MTVHGGVGGGDVKMRRFDVSDFAPRGDFRRRYVGPGFSFILGEMDQAIVGASPDFSGANRRWSDGVDYAVAFAFGRIFRSGRIEIGGHSGIFAREVPADLLPGAAVVVGSEQHLRTKGEDVRIAGRKKQGQRPGMTKLARLRQRRRHLLYFLIV